MRATEQEAAKVVITAARRLDAELSEATSTFDNDGVYERYWRYRAEPGLVEALRAYDSLTQEPLKVSKVPRFFRSALFPLILIVIIVYVASQFIGR